jgi:hypothetical protein
VAAARARTRVRACEADQKRDGCGTAHERQGPSVLPCTEPHHKALNNYRKEIQIGGAQIFTKLKQKQCVPKQKLAENRPGSPVLARAAHRGRLCTHAGGGLRGSRALQGGFRRCGLGECTEAEGVGLGAEKRGGGDRKIY